MTYSNRPSREQTGSKSGVFRERSGFCLTSDILLPGAEDASERGLCVGVFVFFLEEHVTVLDSSLLGFQVGGSARAVLETIKESRKISGSSKHSARTSFPNPQPPGPHLLRCSPRLLFLVQNLIITLWSVARRQSISRGWRGPGSSGPARGASCSSHRTFASSLGRPPRTFTRRHSTSGRCLALRGRARGVAPGFG